ncbi:MAG: flagellar protein FlaG [Gammaproteobacteria bacterium]|jgi:flagellar protein FlaG|nr:flagellar protein FlaG [Gammaproteobacteria bacterium]
MENLTAIDVGRATPSVQKAVEVQQLDELSRIAEVAEVARATEAAEDIPQISAEEVQRSVAKINQFFEKTDYGLNFSVDHDTGKDVIKVTDRDNGDVIRQFPSEEILQLSRAVGDLQGFLIKELV